MKKIFLTTLMALALSAQAENLKGFHYGLQTAPSGREWQSPEDLSLNKEQPRAYMFSFPTVGQARQVLPKASPYYQSLDGTWKFNWVPTPEQRDSSFHKLGFDASGWDDIQVPGCWNVQGLQKDGTMKYGIPAYVNQPVLFYHEVAVDDWKKGVMRTPPVEWTTYKYRNEVGSYLRRFTVPQAWKGRQIFINFDGVDSFFYLWINGRYVGFSKNSRNTAQFNITPFLNKKGENTVAVEVYRHSDGSFLESQDMFRLPGIIRSTYLTATPELEIRDMAVRTTSIRNGMARVNVQIELRNHGKQRAMNGLRYDIFPVDLYSDKTGEAVASLTTGLQNVNFDIRNPKLWSAEEPNRYVMVVSMLDKKGRVVDAVSTYFGVRTVEIRETEAKDDEFGLAGRYFYVNDKPVKLKGVNRHETNPTTGHAISHEQMEREVMLMKRGNINHVRLAHYSNDPYFYYLSDKYGLYLEDEANLESHQYYYGAASLSHPKEWEAAHVARNMELVRAHVNHPSIVIWSLGNEAGPGKNFQAAYNAIKAFDTSRPIQYERDTDNGWRNVDMGSNQYPSVAWVQQAVRGKYNIKYPFHISEFAHSMGNSLGNFVDYWEAMESTNFFCGGAIWDWVDQAIIAYTKDGKRYTGYGGDHGEWPNDGMFCMNGIMLPDLSPKPQYFEVKKVLQNVGLKLTDPAKGTVEVLNKNYFLPLDYDVIYIVSQEGREISRGTLPQLNGLQPRRKTTVDIPVKLAADQDNVTLEVQFLLKQDMPWAKKGYVQMSEQFELRQGSAKTPYQPIAQVAKGSKPNVSVGEARTTIQGEGFRVVFDNLQGSISELEYNGQALFAPDCGPKLDAFRAPVDNDNWARDQWFHNGLYDLRHRTTAKPIVTQREDGSVSIFYSVWSQSTHQGLGVKRPGQAGQPYIKIEQVREMTPEDFHFTQGLEYNIFPDGSVQLAASIVSSDPSVVLPRLGYAMKLPTQFDRYAYYGRGPLNNYADRKSGSFFGLYESTVQEQFVNFAKPQSMGNREDVSWCALTDKSGQGAAFIANYESRMSTSALPWSAVQMTLALHPHELPQSDGTYLHLDCQVTGLGGNSCGQGGPLEHDRVKGSLHQMSFIIRPLNRQTDRRRQVNVLTSYGCPVSIVRNRAGKVTIQGDQYAKNNDIMYRITSAGTRKTSKAMRYDGQPIDLKKGGTVEAWYAQNPACKVTERYAAIETVPMEVSFVSSEETPNGEVGANLVDGDPTTIWHTMYSITMGTHPHWIEFDINEVKTVKGFTYLPRQDGQNGDVKDYELRLSMDGKNWSEPVAKGSFPRNKKEQKVMLGKPQKARFVRFTALSSQNGDVFGSGAEFGVIAE